RVDRVVPGAGGQLHHAGHHPVVDPHPRQSGAPVVPHPDDVAVGQPAGGGVVGVDAHDLPAGDLVLGAGTAVVELGVQPGAGLVGDQVELVGLGVAQPLGWLEPGGVRRAPFRLGV